MNNEPIPPLKTMTRAAILMMALMGMQARLAAVGSWTPLSNLIPTSSAGHMLLLSDGTVMVQDDGGNHWSRLSPDTQGHYVHGQWTALHSMNDARAFYSSEVLTDGRVFVAGGEYGNSGTQFDPVGARAEIYDPVADSWQQINPPASLLNYTNQSPAGNDNQLQAFYDSNSILLPNGSVLVAPVNPSTYNGTLIYLPALSLWTNGPDNLYNPQGIGSQAETSWVKLPDDSILTIDPAGNDVVGTNAERYIPSLNRWIADQGVPVALFDAVPGSIGEIGAAFLLGSGSVAGDAFYLGASGHTAFYTPSGNTTPGAWTQGPDIPNGYVTADAPAAMLVNGKILCAVTPAANHGTNYFYEFDPVTQAFTQVGSPTGGLYDNYNISDRTSMLDLPDGTVLYNDSSQRLFVYTPDPATLPLAAGKPAVNYITYNTDGSLHLAGTLFNGISQGAGYGDESQQDSNYPLVRFTDGSGNVFYGRTYNWSSTSVMSGSRQVTTDCALPANIFYFDPGVAFSISIVANGISSDPITFYGPDWVDFNYTSVFQIGSYFAPFGTLANGIANVPVGGTIAIKPGHSSITPTLSKPMIITAVGGTAIIGQ